MKYNKAECLPIATKAYRVFIEGLSSLPEGKYRTVRQICGKSYWHGLTVAERIFVGKFIFAAVKLGMFGLTRPYQDSSNHWRYCLE